MEFEVNNHTAYDIYIITGNTVVGKTDIIKYSPRKNAATSRKLL